MKKRHIFLIIGAWAVLMAVALLIVLIPWRVAQAFSILLLGVLYLGPFKLAEDAYDFVDKVLDSRFMPEVKIHWSWHFLFAALVGSLFLVLWPGLTVLIVTDGNWYVAEWLSYLRQLDKSPGLLGYPAYAVRLGEWAAVTAYVGYVYEMALLSFTRWFQARRESNGKK